jgi:hypothetical protein
MMQILNRTLRRLAKAVFGHRLDRAATAVACNIRALENFGRPGWLYRSKGVVPRSVCEFRAVLPLTDADIALCQRLVDSYVLAEKDAPTPSGMWSHEVFQYRQRALVHALQRRDAGLLAERLASMFRSDFVLGFAPGSLAIGRSGVGARFAALHALDKFVALAESQVVARIENPEQRVVGLAFANGVEPLVARTEAVLGVSLDFPNVGAAYWVEMAGRLITPETPDQIYGAARLRDAMKAYLSNRKSPLHVVEIGGGYGGMAYWLLRMSDVRYTIIDLPVVNVMQGYFLSQALGVSEVSLYGEKPKRVMIVPTHALSDVELPFDVLANKDSMPEIPEPAVLDYLTWARSGCSGIFYSYNHEAATPADGIPQNVVPEIVERIGGFARLRRDASWLRRGYVEEIYRPLMPVSTSSSLP